MLVPYTFPTHLQTTFPARLLSRKHSTFRSTTLHEIVHLTDYMACNPENRALFIEHVFMTFSDDLDARSL